MPIIQAITQKSQTERKNLANWADLLLLVFLFLYILAGIKITPFHGDESTYIWISEDYDRIVKQGKLNQVLYAPEGNAKQYLRLSTGSILAYSIGFVRDITQNHDPITKWLWGSSWEENISQGNLPTARLLNLARACSAVMGGLAIIFLFLSARLLFSSRLSAYSSVLIFATQGDVLLNIHRAMQEGPKFLFLTLNVYLAVHILKGFQNGRTNRVLYLSLGISSGLALATKQDLVPMLVAIYGALGIILIWQKQASKLILINILFLGAATIIAYAVFLICMPVFWKWWESAIALIGIGIILYQLPFWKNSRTSIFLTLASLILIISMTLKAPAQWTTLFTPVQSMVKLRQEMSPASHESNWLKNKAAFFAKTILFSKAMYMEVASFDVPPFHAQIQAYEDSFFSGRTDSTLIDLSIMLLAIIGGLALLMNFNSESLFTYALLVISGVLLFLATPLPWQRYLLIMQIPYSLLAGVGISSVWNRLQGLTLKPKNKQLPLG